MKREELKENLARHSVAFCEHNPDLKPWVEQIISLICRLAEKNKCDSTKMVEVTSKNYERMILGLAGSEIINPANAKNLQRLDDLFARWHADGLALVPSPVSVTKVNREYCIDWKSGDEVRVAAFNALWDYFLYRNLYASVRADKFTDEDFRACSALFALYGSGDLLVSSPAHVLANFSVQTMSFYQPWTISAWYKRAAFRWPISWPSAIYLFGLLAITPKRFRTHPYFFGDRYFAENVHKDTNSSPRIPLKTNSGRIILHDTFNKWLRMLSRLAEKSGVDIPAKLTLRTVIRAARIRAAMVFPPAIVSYLSAKLPCPPLDNYSWEAIHLGKVVETSELQEHEGHLENKRISRKKPVSDVQEKEKRKGEQFFRQALLILKNGHTQKLDKGIISRSIIDLANRLPAIPDHHGEQAYLGTVRAALLYLANRTIQPKTTLETLILEQKFLQDIATDIIGKKSLAALSEEESTGMCAEYMRSFNSSATQSQRRSLLKRFLSTVDKMSTRIFKQGLSMDLPNWRHPDLNISWNRKPRRILTPRHLVELVDDATSNMRDERDISLLAHLGFYCGLREREILSLSNDNCTSGLSEDVELDYSKTEAGIRRLPVSQLVPEPNRKIVVNHLKRMDGGQKSKPLIEDGPRSLQRFERQLARKFGASSHTLRHSAASMMVLKLCLAQNLVDDEPVSFGFEQLRKNLMVTQGDEFSKSAIVAFADGLMGPGWRKSWPMAIPVVSKLLGHLQPGVTVQVYLHVIELIAAHTRDLIEWPPMNQVQAAAMSKTSRTTLIKHLGLSDGELYTAEEIAVYMATRYLPNELF